MFQEEETEEQRLQAREQIVSHGTESNSACREAGVHGQGKKSKV